MLILLLKTLQPGLFDKLVPVAGGVTKEGVVRKPHVAIRHVRPVQPKAKPVEHHVDDLFAHADRKAAEPPKPKAAPKPAAATGDLFAERPKTNTSPEPVKETPKTEHVAAPPQESTGERFRYGVVLRPAHSTTLPPGFIAGSARPDDRFAHGTAEFDHRLTAQEVDHFDLVDLAAKEERASRNSKLQARIDANPALAQLVSESGVKLDHIDDALLDELEGELRASAPARTGIDYSGPFDPSKVPTWGVKPGTSKGERRRLNATAQMLVESKSDFTPEELDILRQYSGNGGCGDSLNEFYTDPAIAAAMWHALTRLGMPAGAEVLEPSCATGVFLATAPDGAKVTGVEMDPVSARIGGVLHPGHEVACASFERFATGDTRQFDVVIGNAPFGESRGSLLKDDKKDLSRPEYYFLDTSLDKAKSGGLVAMVVPTGIMNGKNQRWLRERLLRKGEFLGGIRMPNTAFETSHTDVTTDILFFRKRPDDVAGALSAGRRGDYAVSQDALKRLGAWDDDFLAGSYFEERGAKNVMGTVGTAMRSFGEIYAVLGSMQGVPEAIADFDADRTDTSAISVPAILEAVPEDQRSRVLGGAITKPYTGGKRGDVKMIDGVEYILEGEPLRWHRVDEFAASDAVTQAVELGLAIDSAMQGEAPENLAARVRAYVEKFGNPNKNAELQLAAHRDKLIYRLLGAVKPDGSLSDVVEGRKATVVEASFDAAAQSLALELGAFSPEQVAARWHGGDSEAVLDHLYASPDYALDPESGQWTSTDQYLSGELWPKFDQAKAALGREGVNAADRGKFERQAKLLEETIDPKSLEDVEIELNSAFLPLGVVAAFFNSRLATYQTENRTSTYAANIEAMEIAFDKGIYTAKGGLWGDADLLLKYLNRSGVRKDEDLPKIQRWNAEFKEWLCGSADRDRVEELYNRNFRGFRQRDYSSEPFDIPGLAGDDIRPWIYSGIRAALETGGSILADDVGLGKTAQGLILARMAKVTGKAQRPMIVVPKQVLANWVVEAEKWFPGSKVMTIGETLSHGKDGELKGKTDSAAERNRKLHELTQNDYDFVLITQPAWNDLDLDPTTKAEFVEQDFWVQRGNALGNEGDARLKAIRKAKEAYEAQTAKRDFQKRTDAIYFNKLGVDMIIGDEMHAFKNLFAARNRFGQQPKFLGGSGLSNRALDMQLKSKWVRDHNGGGSVYGLTATPTKNSPLEVYSMLSHIAPQAFERIGVRNSEEFLDRFCEFKTENILNTRGQIEEALVTVGFKNLDELREIMRRYINRRTAEQVGLQLPRPDRQEHLVDMSAEQNAVYADLRQLAEEAAGKKDATGEAHIFSIMDKMGKAAMDLEMYDPVTYAGAESPKYAEAVKHIVAGVAEGGQVVFADSIATHAKLRDRLIKAGIPADKIAIINAQEASSAASRQNICDAFNAGKLRVVIGNTATMGEGLNLQKGTTDIHHLDLPWEPASMQQRNGRGLRQGNTSEAVRLHSYIAKGSFDGYRYQTLMAKKDWQDLLWNGGDRVENLAREGAVSRDDMMIMLSADPEEARKKLDENKAAALEKFNAMRHGEATKEFQRLVDMRRSYGALKNKETAAANRLHVRIDQLKTKLAADPFFKAKRALDSDAPLVIQPNTGEPFETGDAFESGGDSAIDGGGKFVVTAVFPQVSRVQVRRYGAARARPITLDIDALGNGVSKIEYDAKAEEAEITSNATADAQAQMSDLSSYKDLHGLPAWAVEGAYEPLQRQIKEGMKSYKFHAGGTVGMVTPEGKPHAAASYEAKGLLDTHDVMLPTAKHRELAMQGYLDDARAKTWRMEATGKGRQQTSSLKTIYPGGYAQRDNRWSDAGKAVFGDTFETDAKARLETEQYGRARKAKTLTAAISDLLPLHEDFYGMPKAFPRRALAVMWAKARQGGDLDKPFDSVLPGGAPKALFDGKDNFAPQGRTVAQGLVDMARRTDPDLAVAMALHARMAPAEVARIALDSHLNTMGPVLEHLLSKHPELERMKASDVAQIHRGTTSYYSGSTPGHPLHERFGAAAQTMTLREMADSLTAHDVPGAPGGETRHAA